MVQPTRTIVRASHHATHARQDGRARQPPAMALACEDSRTFERNRPNAGSQMVTKYGEHGMKLPIPANDNIADDEPLPLAEACKLFPYARLTPSTLRAEHIRGRLVIFQLGKRDYTTFASMKEANGTTHVCIDEGDGAQMPRRRAAPRLYLDPKRKQWVIRDGASFVRTGCAESERSDAEKHLHACSVRRPSRRRRASWEATTSTSPCPSAST